MPTPRRYAAGSCALRRADVPRERAEPGGPDPMPPPVVPRPWRRGVVGKTRSLFLGSRYHFLVGLRPPPMAQLPASVTSPRSVSHTAAPPPPEFRPTKSLLATGECLFQRTGTPPPPHCTAPPRPGSDAVARRAKLEAEWATARSRSPTVGRRPRPHWAIPRPPLPLPRDQCPSCPPLGVCASWGGGLNSLANTRAGKWARSVCPSAPPAA